jgi:hypothetical protein
MIEETELLLHKADGLLIFYVSKIIGYKISNLPYITLLCNALFILDIMDRKPRS